MSPETDHENSNCEENEDLKSSEIDGLVYSELTEKTDKFNEAVESERRFANEKRKSSVGLQRILSEGDDEEDVQDIDMILKEMELTDDLSCGYWFFRGAFLQRFVLVLVLIGYCVCVYYSPCLWACDKETNR